MTIKSGNPGGVKENVAATHFDFLQTCDLLTSHPAFMKSRSQRQSCKADRPAARMSGFTTAECLSGIDKIIMIFHKKDANNTYTDLSPPFSSPVEFQWQSLLFWRKLPASVSSPGPLMNTAVDRLTYWQAKKRHLSPCAAMLEMPVQHLTQFEWNHVKVQGYHIKSSLQLQMQHLPSHQQPSGSIVFSISNNSGNGLVFSLLTSIKLLARLASSFLVYIHVPRK